MRPSMVDGHGKIELVWTNSPGSVAALSALVKKLIPLHRLGCQIPLIWNAVASYFRLMGEEFRWCVFGSVKALAVSRTGSTLAR